MRTTDLVNRAVLRVADGAAGRAVVREESWGLLGGDVDEPRHAEHDARLDDLFAQAINSKLTKTTTSNWTLQSILACAVTLNVAVMLLAKTVCGALCSISGMAAMCTTASGWKRAT